MGVRPLTLGWTPVSDSSWGLRFLSLFGLGREETTSTSRGPYRGRVDDRSGGSVKEGRYVMPVPLPSPPFSDIRIVPPDPKTETNEEGVEPPSSHRFSSSSDSTEVLVLWS